MQSGVQRRDFVVDWKKWNRAERVPAVMMVALRLGLLKTG